MSQTSAAPTLTTERLIAAAQELAAALDRVVLGQRAAVETLLVAYMAGGHALLEGVPGLGKTLLARAFASVLGARFSRVQFTPDLMPADELDLYRQAVAGTLVGFGEYGGELPGAVLRPGEALALRQAARRVHVAEELLAYLAELAAGVRRSPQVDLAVSPRAALALLEAARASALLEGRDFLTPDDLKRLLVPCWAHRVLLTPESELEA